MFGRFHKVKIHPSDSQVWREQWQSIVPPECRNVSITVDGVTMVAFIQINHYVLMLQDGLLMEGGFFRVCDHFMRAGYHVLWLMRCTQDVKNHYLKLRRMKDHGRICYWTWRKPTTNFGRWTSDNSYVSILLQVLEIPEGPLAECGASILQRVQWAESCDSEKKIPSRTRFMTAASPGSPKELAQMLNAGYHSPGESS